MPDGKHASHGDVTRSAGDPAHLLREFQQVDELLVHLYRFHAGAAVDGADVVHALIAVVDIRELVVFLKQGIDLLAVLGERFLVLLITDYLCHSVEEFKVRLGVALLFLSCAAR